MYTLHANIEMAFREWNFANLPSSNTEAILWAREHGLLRISKNCWRHRVPMKLYETGAHGTGRFHCPKGREKCAQYVATIDSFFENFHMPLDKTIKLIYCFSRDFSYKQMRHELCDLNIAPEKREQLSSETITAWFNYCREMIVDHFSDIQKDKPKLGGFKKDGTPIVIEVDEAKFGKRKYNKGRVMEGHWVFGIVDTETKDCRMIVVKDRKAATLIPIIKHVVPGSEIHTDCFSSYKSLLVEGYIHKTVNHSIEFKALDGTHANTIQSNWRPAKDWMRGGHYGDENFAGRLCEYLWRRFCRINHIDFFSSLIEAICKQYVFK